MERYQELGAAQNKQKLSAEEYAELRQLLNQKPEKFLENNPFYLTGGQTPPVSGCLVIYQTDGRKTTIFKDSYYV